MTKQLNYFLNKTVQQEQNFLSFQKVAGGLLY